MTTIRVGKRKQYARIERAAIEDATLSFRARGILAWLLSKPDDWECDGRAIANASEGEGRDAIYTALRELAERGYLERRKWQDPATGQWQHESIVRESPISPVRPDPGFQDPGNQDPGSQDPDSQEVRTNDDQQRLLHPPTPHQFAVVTEDGDVPRPANVETTARLRSGEDLSSPKVDDETRARGLAQARAIRETRERGKSPDPEPKVRPRTKMRREAHQTGRQVDDVPTGEVL